MIYLTPDGKIYTEGKNGKIEKLDNITSMAPKPNKMNNSMQMPRKSMIESQSVPMIAPVEKTFSRPENLNLNEPILPFPTPGMHSPFIFPSPSIQFDNRRADEISLMTDPNRQFGFVYGFTPTQHNNFRQIDRRSFGHNQNLLSYNNDRGEDNIRFGNFE